MPQDRRVRRNEKFGEALVAAMERRGVSNKWLAAKTGVHAVQVSRWRKGELPDELRLPKIAEALEVDEKELRSTGETADSVQGDELGPAVDPFTVGVRAMTETMRRQIEALDHLVGTDERGQGIHEMLASMMRQVGALEILLLGKSARAGGVSFEVLVADMRAAAESGDPGAGKDRRSGEDRRGAG